MSFISTASGVIRWRRPLGRSEPENADEDGCQEEQSEDRTDTSAESLGDGHVGQHDEDDLDEWNEVEDRPPCRLPAHLRNEKQIDDWNEGENSGNPSLREHLPESDCGDDQNGEVDDQ